MASLQVGSRLGPRRAGKLRLHMKGLPHLKENRINLKKKSTTFRGFGTERARLSTFRGFGTERARLGTFRGFGTERARLGTFRGFGTELGDPPPPRNRILNL